MRGKAHRRSIGILILLLLAPLMVLFEDDMDAHFESARFGVDEGKLIWLLLRSIEFEGDKSL